MNATELDVIERPLEARYGQYHSQIAAQFPSLGPFSVDEVSPQMDEPDDHLDIETLVQRRRVFQHQGHAEDVALELALREQMVTVYAPPGHLLARLTVAGPRPRQVRLVFRHRPGAAEG